MQTQIGTGQRTMLATSRVMPILLLLLCLAGTCLAQTVPSIATDYEWQLNEPGRTLFRDRLPVGNIELVAGKKEKATGEVLQVLTDIAFQPGDTARYFAVNLRLVESNRVLAEVITDAVEIPELIGAARYAIETSRNIAGTDRPETLVTFRTRAGFTIELLHFGTDQQLSVQWPDKMGGIVSRVISLDQLSLFTDLLDLTIFELNRQGAGLKLKTAKQ